MLGRFAALLLLHAGGRGKSSAYPTPGLANAASGAFHGEPWQRHSVLYEHPYHNWPTAYDEQVSCHQAVRPETAQSTVGLGSIPNSYTQ